jgi:peptidoglycan-N-acetylglucosamine deacetylase
MTDTDNPVEAIMRARFICSFVACLLGIGAPALGHTNGTGQPLGAFVYSSSLTIHKVVALTFDDGPSPYSYQVLHLLNAYHAQATFFVVGARIALYPDVPRAELASHDDIGNHTYTHPDLELLTRAQIAWQLWRTQVEIRSATGATSHWFRPPYGAIDHRIAGLAADQGLYSVIWSVDPEDWTLPGVRPIVQRVLDAVRAGSIVILHDGGGDRSETVQALSRILPALRDRGYRFITLDEMFFPSSEPSIHPFAPSRMRVPDALWVMG